MIREINYYDLDEMNEVKKLLIKYIPHAEEDIVFSLSLLEVPELMENHKEHSDLVGSQLFGFFISGKLLAVCGLYSLQEDHVDSFWVNWFAVDGKYRKLTIGTQMFHFLCAEVSRKEKKFIKVYTTIPRLKFFWSKHAEFVKEIEEDGTRYIYFKKEVS